MKHPLINLGLAGIFAVCFEGRAGDETPQSKHTPSSTSSDDVPIQNYWDSQSWEVSSGLNFWHQLNEKDDGKLKTAEGRRRVAALQAKAQAVGK